MLYVCYIKNKKKWKYSATANITIGFLTSLIFWSLSRLDWVFEKRTFRISRAGFFKGQIPFVFLSRECQALIFIRVKLVGDEPFACTICLTIWTWSVMCIIFTLTITLYGSTAWKYTENHSQKTYTHYIARQQKMTWKCRVTEAANEFISPVTVCFGQVFISAVLFALRTWLASVLTLGYYWFTLLCAAFCFNFL